MKSQSSSGHLDNRRLADQAGVVHENVQTAEPPVGLAERPGDLVGKADVAANGVDLAAAAGDFGGDRLGLVEMQVEDGHLGAFAHEGLGDGAADARCAAGDNRFLAR